MSSRSRKPRWMPQEEWDEWIAGEEERERELWERVKVHEARAARERAEAEANEARKVRRRRLFGFL